MQSTLFSTTNNQQDKNALIITNQKEQPLSKQQQAFNRLVKKIEKLRLDLNKTNCELNEKLDYYAKYIHPLEQQVTIMRKEAVSLLFSFYTNKKLLLKQERKTLKDFIAIQLKEISMLDKNEPDEQFKKIFEAVNEISYDKATNQEFEEMKDEMEAMFKSHGFNMDFTDMHKNMTEEEIIKKIKNMQEEFFEQEENKSAGKKTAKQLQKEEKERQLEEARNKNIGSIYKQLAKALHPDLEQDEDMKIEKEALMKQLTAAYDNNDLHSLLRLEMEWIHKEEKHTDKFSNEKLAIYNEVLKEQVQELEEEIYGLKQHPRFEPLMRYNNFSFGQFYLNSVNLPKEKRNIEETIESLKVSIKNLKGQAAIKEVRQTLSIFNHAKQFDLMDEFIKFA